MGSAQLGPESISSASASVWSGTFTVDYTDVLNQPETLTIVGDGSTGTITDSDPDAASGIWTAVSTVPDPSSTMLLLGLATATLGGLHFLQNSKSGLALFKN